MSLPPRAAQLLATVRARRHAPPGATPAAQPHALRRYKVIGLSLYLDQLEYLDALADALKRTRDEPRNRSGAIQWLLEEHRKIWP